VVAKGRGKFRFIMKKKDIPRPGPRTQHFVGVGKRALFVG